MDEKVFLAVTVPIMRERDGNPTQETITLGEHSRDLLGFISEKIGLSRDDAVYFFLSRGMVDWMDRHPDAEYEYVTM